MRMGKLLKRISLTLKKVDDKIKFKSINKESLIAQIEDSKQFLSVVDSTMFSLNKKQLEDVQLRAIANVADSKMKRQLGKEGVALITKLENKLGRSAARQGNIFGAMAYTNKIMLKLSNDIKDNVDNILGEKEYVTINNTTLSHGIFLGVLESTKMYARFNSYYLALLSRINTNTVAGMPRHIISYLTTNADNYAKLVGQMCSVTGKWSVINDITNIKSNGLDLRFYVDDNNHAGMRSKLITDVLGIENIFISLFNVAIAPIALIGEVYVDARHQHYQDIQTRKKWLEMHIATLRLDLDDLNKNHPDYLKSLEAIDYYEDKVMAHQQSLDKYYEA